MAADAMPICRYLNQRYTSLSDFGGDFSQSLIFRLERFAMRAPTEPPLQWKIDECSSYFGRMRIRGWCFVPFQEIRSVEIEFQGSFEKRTIASYGLPSPDVANAISGEAHHVRFDEWVTLPQDYRGQDMLFRVVFKSGEIVERASIFDNARAGDPAHMCWSHFVDNLEKLPSGRILECGSRARSGHIVKNLIPEKHRYVGLDILGGPNVDVVGDIHEASSLFSKEEFDAVFSRSVFEHLAMPWKAVIEINRVMKPGGLFFATTHQTWVLHEEPWDFWRYSKHTWATLLNRATGFEILETAQGEPARIHALWNSPIVYDMASNAAFLSSAVIARKVSETKLTWPVSTDTVAVGLYPPGELVR